VYELDGYIPNRKIVRQAGYRLARQAESVDHFIYIFEPPALPGVLRLLGKLRKRVLYLHVITSSVIKGVGRSNECQFDAR